MTYRFGIFTFDDRAAILTRSDRPVALEPQPARALGLLLSRAGEGVSLVAHYRTQFTYVIESSSDRARVGKLRSKGG